MKKLLIPLFASLIALLIPASASATLVPTTVYRDTVSSFIRPINSSDNLQIPALGGSGVRCIQVDNSGNVTIAAAACGSGGGSGGGSGTWGTTTSQVAGQLINYSLNNTDIVSVGGTSTSTSKFYVDPNLTLFKSTIPFLETGASSTLQNFTFVNATGTAATTTRFAITNLSSALALAAANGALSNYGGSANCTNQVINGISAVGAGNCVSISNAMLASNILGSGTNGQLAYFSGNNLLSGVSTSTPTVIAPITYSGTLGSFVGGAAGTFDCTSATGSVKGCLTAADWTTFNNKGSGTVTSVTSGGYPIVSTGGATPAISFNGLSTTSPWTNGQVAYVSSGNQVTSVATGTISGAGGVTVTAGQSIIGSGLTITCTVGTASAAGCLPTADWSRFDNKISSSSLSGASVISYTGSTGVITTTGGTFGAGNYIFPAQVTHLGSTTMQNFTGVNATTTQLTVTSLTSGNCLQATVGGRIIDTGSACGSGGGGASYPFAGTGNSTSTLTQFNGGLTAYASSTIGNHLQAGGLTIDGGATTTGTHLINTLNLTNALTVQYGGTGLTSVASNCVIIGSTATSFSTACPITDNRFLQTSGGGLSWSTIDLSVAANFANQLSVAKGGTGATTFGQGWIYSTGGTTALNSSTSPTVNYLVATSTLTASTFPYASTTMVTAQTASTTNLIVSSAGGTGTRCLQVASDGTVSANASACGSGSGTPDTVFSTSSPLNANSMFAFTSVAMTTGQKIQIWGGGGTGPANIYLDVFMPGGGTTTLSHSSHGGTGDTNMVNVSGTYTATTTGTVFIALDSTAGNTITGLIDPTITYRLGTGGVSGTNYLTNSGANTYLNTGTNLQAPVVNGTSTTVASSFVYASTTSMFTAGLMYKAFSFAFATATPPFTGSTTAQIGPTVLQAETWLGAACYTDVSGSTANIQFFNRGAKLDMIPASSTPAYFTFTTNNTLTALATTSYIVGTSSPMTGVSCTVKRLSPAN